MLVFTYKHLCKPTLSTVILTIWSLCVFFLKLCFEVKVSRSYTSILISCEAQPCTHRVQDSKSHDQIGFHNCLKLAFFQQWGKKYLIINGNVLFSYVDGPVAVSLPLELQPVAHLCQAQECRHINAVQSNLMLLNGIENSVLWIRRIRVDSGRLDPDPGG